MSNDVEVNIENSWIFLSKEGFTKESETFILTLNHPGHGRKCKFLLNKSSNKICEIQLFENAHRSWLIDQTVRKNGNIYVCTPMDPLFVVLPVLKEQCSTRAVPLEHILQSSDDLELKEIYSTITSLDAIGDLKGPKNLNAYKYNETKALTWLESKIKNVVEILKKKKVHVKSGAVAATFVVSSIQEEEVDEEYYLSYAFGIVSEYLNDDFAQLLRDKMNIKIESDATKRKSSNEIPLESKKIKLDSEVDTSRSSNVKSEYFSNNSHAAEKKAKPVTISAKEKQRQKAASGSKNISSFFSKKT